MKKVFVGRQFTKQKPTKGTLSRDRFFIDILFEGLKK
jgi:hypothetical protein